MTLRLVLTCLIVGQVCCMDRISVTFNQSEPGETKFVGAARPAIKDSLLQFQLRCPYWIQESNIKVAVDFTVRSSPCDQEFDIPKDDAQKVLKQFFCHPDYSGQPQLSCKYLWGQVSTQSATLNCGHNNFTQSPTYTAHHTDWLQMNVSHNDSAPAACRALQLSAQNSKATEEFVRYGNVIIRIPEDSIFLVDFQVRNINGESGAILIDVDWDWIQPGGFRGNLSPEEWPLMPFYGTMGGVYAIFALVWLVNGVMNRHQLSPIHFVIFGVVAVFVCDAAAKVTMTGMLNGAESDFNMLVIQKVVRITSVSKFVAVQMLLITLSAGYGTVTKQLEFTGLYIVMTGVVQFVLLLIMGSNWTVVDMGPFVWVSVALEGGIIFWIMSALATTLRTIWKSKQPLIRDIYHKFVGTILLSIAVSCLFVSFSLLKNAFWPCNNAWKTRWTVPAFWNLLHATVLLVIMILWRPKSNHSHYRPLIDDFNATDNTDAVYYIDVNPVANIKT